jgi:large subunit ribosomal protein L18
MSSRKDLKLKALRCARRKRHIRRSVFGTSEKPRLTVYRSHKNIYCQLIDDARGVTLASASTLAEEVKGTLTGFPGNCASAAQVGKAIAEKAKSIGIALAQFDRNGYRFHGRIKALAEAARQAGLKF